MFRQQARFGRDGAAVVRCSAGTFNAPLAWQKRARALGVTRRVFSCSWSDFFIPEADAWRAEAWAIVRACPDLVFQILTKRPERILGALPSDWGAGYPNVWLGVSVESARYLSRVETLRSVPARVRFVSAEPLLEPLPSLDLTGIDWLIVGGESGPQYRPMDPAWALKLQALARRAGVPFFFKQSAALYPEHGIMLNGTIYREYPALSGSGEEARW